MTASPTRSRLRALALLTDAFGGHGGIAQYNRHFLAALAQHPACDEVVALPRLMPGPAGPLPPRVTHVTAGLGGKLSFLLAAVWNVMWRRRFDLIFCAHINLLPLALALRAMTGSRLLLQIHGIDAWQPPRSRLLRGLPARVDLCVSVSRVTRERFLSWSPLAPERCVVLPNTVREDHLGVPEHAGAAMRQRLGLGMGPVIMTLGRLVSRERCKGFDEVLDVLPSLLVKHPGLVYVIAGDGNDRGRLEAKVRALGLERSVRFTGAVSEKDKMDLYAMSDAFVMPSRGEGFGIVLLEAMVVGTPVVASAIDGGRDALRDGTAGILVHPDRADALVDGIHAALSRPRAVPDAMRCFDFANYSDRLHKIVGLLFALPPSTGATDPALP